MKELVEEGMRRGGGKEEEEEVEERAVVRDRVAIEEHDCFIWFI